MSTIPLIFNQHQIDMVSLGGKEAVPGCRVNAAAILINKSWSQNRSRMIENLARCGFREIVSIETDPENYNMDDFSKRYAFVKFIIPLEQTSDGELINMAVGEIKSEYFLVLRDSLDFQNDVISSTLCQNLIEMNRYCIAPRLLERGGIAFPVLFSPSIHKGSLKLQSTATVSDGLPDLIPFDYIGLYNRKKFIDLGGFDYTIVKPYWQNLDLAFRAWLWGEEIVFSTAFSLCYNEAFPSMDSTAGLSSNRFYLKNLVPRYNEDHGFIPRLSFFVFLKSSSCGFFEAKAQFKEAQEWVENNKYCFRRDAVNLVENWSNR
ncbi:MAG: hypothetical protein KBT11_03285 [Treponema sp.]|nr:hypothetical protein [Candidatus Treponema equifaecale]